MSLFSHVLEHCAAEDQTVVYILTDKVEVVDGQPPPMHVAYRRKPVQRSDKIHSMFTVVVRSFLDPDTAASAWRTYSDEFTTVTLSFCRDQDGASDIPAVDGLFQDFGGRTTIAQSCACSSIANGWCIHTALAWWTWTMVNSTDVGGTGERPPLPLPGDQRQADLDAGVGVPSDRPERKTNPDNDWRLHFNKVTADEEADILLTLRIAGSCLLLTASISNHNRLAHFLSVVHGGLQSTSVIATPFRFRGNLTKPT